MKINKGVEWAAHACTVLAALPPGWMLTAEALAEYHGVPPAYMAKQMQALSRAGLIISQRGAVGGYRLAKPPVEISLWDITEAIEGGKPAFQCTEIRQNGPCAAHASECTRPCGIATSFLAAEKAFRDSLGDVSLLEMMQTTAAEMSAEKARRIADWIMDNAIKVLSA